MPAPLPPPAKQISVKFSAEETARVEDYAQSVNMSNAAAIRSIVLGWLGDPHYGPDKFNREREMVRRLGREAAIRAYADMRSELETALAGALGRIDDHVRQLEAAPAPKVRHPHAAPDVVTFMGDAANDTSDDGTSGENR